MKRVLGGVLAALGAMGMLIGVLLMVLRKGPISALLILVLMAALVFVISVIQVLVERKRGG
jgi:hypothetical protein